MATQILDTDARHPFSLIGLADRAWNTALELSIHATRGPLARGAEAMVLSVMRNIAAGQLRISTPRETFDFPSLASRTECVNGVPSSESDPVKAEIRVRSDAFWIRLCLMGDLGFSEAYMYGEVECDDLVSLFKIFLMNKSRLERLDSKFSYLFTLPQKLTSYRFLNTLSNSRSNISAHYDISNEMFAGFLSQDMTYSCAIFADLDGDLRPTYPREVKTTRNRDGIVSLKPPFSLPSPPGSHSPSDSGLDSGVDISHTPSNDLGLSKTDVSEDLISRLEKSTQGRKNGEENELYLAQLRKLDHIIAKLKIPSDRPTRVLEIGSGWGSMSIRIAQKYPLATVDTLTLSSQQQDLAQQRIAEQGSGVASRITVHLMDYRAMPSEWEASFDRVVSVEMIEAVGKEFLEVYWRTIDWAMKPKDAVGVVQAITLPEARFDTYLAEIDFIRKWELYTCRSLSVANLIVVFPGGLLPTVTLLLETLKAGSQGRLVVDSISNIGPHYARTLREWCQRFTAKFDSVIRPALMKEYPHIMGEERPDRDMKKAAEEIDVFKRKWIYYYCYCEVGFTTRTLGERRAEVSRADHIMTFAREGYWAYGCDVYN
ncbi:cyclopropane-fatty-acyl-phospholipid synthase [Ephemerocybe angulata]|uniref:Cyclopropane-fatty-acyl-phospholipid synthase n=1 Tax=Ephemerocybe angulata TaxID=980116 RepID=A0A8H6HCJ6_9AGAR|nr:cyclopropane-fatty-acyl-phospholipid synthase [Tulosesus angulatus]